MAAAMIESRYWRTELRADLAWLKKHRAYRRWSEKQQVLFERKLMLAAFQVRSLLERPKVNDQARSTGMSALRYKKIGSRPFTATGSGWPNERFDMEHPESVVLSALDVCNQLIHYYWMETWSEDRSFVSMLVFSDYKRHKWAYEFRIEDLLELFQVFGDDSSAIVGAESRWDEEKQDFVVVKSWGAG
ncbi:hypothetical protein [Planctellipticum variicoloris]|uniref:hypothetical protein n=1 Tax=Planctellipticum variicoloris TaxID=3064265 RepID=UPI003013B638|nr:hypothetical protein SH412_002140 [Planctomycetaceae bacterium SH412]